MKRVCIFVLLFFLSSFSSSSSSGSPYEDLLNSFTPVKNDLIELCRATRKLGPGHACDGIDTPIFSSFLTHLGDQLMGNVKERDQYMQKTLNASTWIERCHAQLLLKDTRTPPVCVAAAYSLVPFALGKTKQHLQISEVVDPTVSPVVNPSDLRLITVSVDSNYKHHRAPTSYSACIYHVKINILGKGIENFYTKGLGGKAALFKSFMEQHVPRDDPNTVILFVDGSDVLFQGDEYQILRRFVQTNARVLFSAEHACYPMKYFPWNLNTGDWLGPCSGACSNSRYVCDQLFPDPSSNHSKRVPGNRWLNSGGFIGYSTEIHQILHDVSNIPGDILNQWPGFDQGLYTNMFLGGKWKIELDYFNLVFQSWGLVNDPHEPTPDGFQLTSQNLVRPIRRGQGTISWMNSYTQRVSPVLHFNADGKGSGMFKRVMKSIHLHMKFNYSDTICSTLHNVVPVPATLK